MVQDNLWDALTQQALIDGTLDQNLTVKQIMDTWTLQKGYPVLTVSRVGNQLRLTQSYHPNNISNSKSNQPRWYIGFTFTTRQQLNWDIETKPIWFRPDQSECECVKWFVRFLLMLYIKNLNFVCFKSACWFAEWHKRRLVVYRKYQTLRLVPNQLRRYELASTYWPT